MTAMNWPSFAVVSLLLTSASIFAQTPQVHAVKVEAAVYPRMALTARVSGEVVVKVTLAPDGTADAVTVLSGPPMLRQAAIDSAKRSQFEANHQNRAEGYQVVYRFVLDQTTKCEHDDSYPRVNFAANVVTVAEQNVPICDPAATLERVRFRSAKVSPTEQLR